ncbi:MAG: glycosyltransferase family 1 protein [Synergistaceae bacterium]|nr:glycosyltransferase family 1 protein [Synergistaceae bacterium]
MTAIRIAHIIGKMRNGGVESAFLAYYKFIDRDKIQYDCIIDEDSTHLQEKQIKDLGGKIIIVPPYQKQFAYQRALSKIFRENNYPLVFSHINSLSVFPLFAAWRAGIPVRVALSQSTAGRGEFARNVMKYTLRLFSKTFATEWCACSNHAGRWLFGNKAMESGKVLIWPNAIETSKFAYNPIKRESVRQELNISNKFVVGHSGRFMTQKNHVFLIDIFNEIHKLKPDSILLLAGDGPLMDKIRKKVHSLGLDESVIFLGSVHNMQDYYQAMDVFILPSLYEGLPVVGSESQVAGLPVLCADTVTSETKFCDSFKFLSLKESPNKWAQEALRISANHERKDMSDSAKKFGFDIKTQAEKMTRWYCKLLGI